ncbi:fungal-specific transcription factor domain-containing protein [Penicillium hispanicum]|uniref:fungal-specific transcription factor domain-containing protein n=1 Tax=Penicillium hispanicum TaxID=1080232 RepID=UPI002540CC98|nr:fungal-specific transcription factor domain-containing protein [Penicillium hispanicum]KAJ5578461.1 fungal-specific transcription factor domain-containing protein [Penicillium hispanicum]
MDRRKPQRRNPQSGARRSAASVRGSRGAHCEYTTSDHRGTAPKSLIDLLQSRINLLEKVLKLHSIDVDASITELKGGEEPLSEGESTTSASPSDFDHLCTESTEALYLDGSLGFECDGEARYFGPSSGRAELLQYLNIDIAPTPHEDTHWTVALGEHSQLGGMNDISWDLAEHLIDIYFQWEQPWHQVVDENLFRQSHKDKGRYFSPLLLNSILALGSRYSDRRDVRSDPDDPSTAGQLFLENAEVMLHFDLRSPTITTIQSLSVMALAYVAIGQDAAGWLRHGMAIRMAIDMGFNLDSTILVRSQQLSAEEAWLRSQIYWALYCTDKLWATYTGRVCTMLDCQSSIPLPSPQPFTEDNSTSGVLSSRYGGLLPTLHRAMSAHCQILENILVNFYGPKKRPPHTQMRTLFEKYLLDLRRWNYSLPVELKVERTGKPNTFPHAYTLNMCYHTSIILICKPFLPKHGAESTQAETVSHPGTESVTQKAISLCAEAAEKISSLSQQYRATFGSFRKSPVTATHCTLSAALVTIQADGPRNQKSGRSTLRHIESCLKTLEQLSYSWAPAERYWRSVQCMIADRQQSRAGHSKANSSIAPVLDPMPGSLEDPSHEEQGASQENPSSGWFSGVSPNGFETEELGLQNSDFLDAFMDQHDALGSSLLFPPEF